MIYRHNYIQKDRQTSLQTDGRTDGWMDGRTETSRLILPVYLFISIFNVLRDLCLFYFVRFDRDLLECVHIHKHTQTNIHVRTHTHTRTHTRVHPHTGYNSGIPNTF